MATPDAGRNADGIVKRFREVGLVSESRGKRDLAQRLVGRKHQLLRSSLARAEQWVTSQLMRTLRIPFRSTPTVIPSGGRMAQAARELTL